MCARVLHFDLPKILLTLQLLNTHLRSHRQLQIPEKHRETECVYLCVCICMCLCVCKCVFVCAYLYLSVYVYVYMCVYLSVSWFPLRILMSFFPSTNQTRRHSRDGTHTCTSAGRVSTYTHTVFIIMDCDVLGNILCVPLWFYLTCFQWYMRCEAVCN